MNTSQTGAIPRPHGGARRMQSEPMMVGKLTPIDTSKRESKHEVPKLDMRKMSEFSSPPYNDNNSDSPSFRDLRSNTDRGPRWNDNDFKESSIVLKTERSVSNKESRLQPMHGGNTEFNRIGIPKYNIEDAPKQKLWLESIKSDSTNVRKLPEYDHMTRFATESVYEVNISHRKFGDDRMYIFACGLRNNSTIRRLNISDNRLTDKGFELILREFNDAAEHRLEIMDISENVIKRHGCEQLVKFIHSSPALRKLTMTNLQLENLVSKRFIDGLHQTRNLVSLNLCHNQLEDLAAQAVAHYIGGSKAAAGSSSSCSLTEMDISWNKIGSTGGIAIIEALRSNKSLTSFDISWNALASSTVRNAAQPISSHMSTMFIDNKTLTHLDISNNHFSSFDCSAMSKGLKENHTLLGLHITGNGGSVAANGELVPDATPWPLEAGHSLSRIIGGGVTGREAWSLRSNCWICGGWREFRFVYSLTQADLCRLFRVPTSTTSATWNGEFDFIKQPKELQAKLRQIHHNGLSLQVGQALLDEQRELLRQHEAHVRKSWLAQLDNIRAMPIYLLTSFDRWVPELMLYSEMTLNYTPPPPQQTAVDALRSSDDDADNIDADSRVISYSIESLEKAIKQLYCTTPSFTFDLYRMVPPGKHIYAFSVGGAHLQADHSKEMVDLTEFSEEMSVEKPSNGLVLPQKINAVSMMAISVDDHLRGGVKALFAPHARPRLYNPGVARLWTPADSLFAQCPHVMNADGYDTACLGADWPLTRASAMKDTQTSNQLHQCVIKRYQLIRDIYVHYSCLYSSEVFYMGIGAFSELISRCKLIDPSLSAAVAAVAQLRRASMMEPAFAGVVSAAVAANKDNNNNPNANSSSSSNTTNIATGTSMRPVPPLMPVPTALSTRRASMMLATKLAQPSSNVAGGGMLGSQLEEGSLESSSALLPLGGGSIAANKSVATAAKRKSVAVASLDQFNRTDVDMIFISNCITGPKHECNGKRYLNRFQFIDAVIGLSHAKYQRAGMLPVPSAVDALNKLIDVHLLPNVEKDDAPGFRNTYLLTEQVDNILRAAHSSLEKVYRANCGAENTVKEERCMCYREWMSLCESTHILDDRVGERTFKLTFCRSMASPLKSLETCNTARQLDFLEFLEAVVRIALAYAIADQIQAAAEAQAQGQAQLQLQQQQQYQRRGSFTGSDAGDDNAPSSRNVSARVRRPSIDGSSKLLRHSASSLRPSLTNPSNPNPSGSNSNSSAMLDHHHHHHEYDEEYLESVELARDLGVAPPTSLPPRAGGGGRNYRPANSDAGAPDGTHAGSVAETQNYEIKLDVPLEAVTEKLSYLVNQLTQVHRKQAAKKADGTKH